MVRRAARIAANLLRHPALIVRSLNVFKYGKRALTLDLPDVALCRHDAATLADQLENHHRALLRRNPVSAATVDASA